MSATEQPLIDLQDGFDQPQVPKDAMAVAEGAGPGSHVLTVIAKRMRAAKKKLTRIEGIEKSRQEGKAINADQVFEACDLPGVLPASLLALETTYYLDCTSCGCWLLKVAAGLAQGNKALSMVCSA